MSVAKRMGEDPEKVHVGVPEVDPLWKEGVVRQLLAAIDMVENAITACPDRLWRDRSRNPECWYLAFHTLFWLDLYLSGSVEGFAPPDPYTLDELDPEGVLPERVYGREELRMYLVHCRAKVRRIVGTLTPEAARRRCRFGWGETTFAELLLYNMRHVQHHTAQLNLILRQETDSAPVWVTRSS